MNYQYDYYYSTGDAAGAAVGIFFLIYYLVFLGLGITSYVMGSLGVQAIAKRRGISHAWLAWIPVANAWVLGSISDQYQYVVNGRIRNKRKTLTILTGLTVAACIALYVIVIAQSISMAMSGETLSDSAAIGMVFGMMGGMFAIFGLAIATAVFHYMALYDLYNSANPSSSVALLLVSIFLNITEPFIVFFNRKKDLGMPLRRDVPQAPVAYSEPDYIPAPPAPVEPWENKTEE